MTRGMLLGKFLPPHQGHRYLVDFARHWADDLSVVVCSIEREPIPGPLRHRWMSEMFPGVRVLHLDEELPQEPSEHPDFWTLWRTSLQRILPHVPDLVFASEDYGERLAAELGGRFVPVDKARDAVPMRATMIRTHPWQHWSGIPLCVRPWFTGRVCIFGPESTGKSTLARRLAAHYDTAFVPEYARTLLEYREGRVEYEDIDWIARGQIASEQALARQANRLLFCDTDPLTTQVWSHTLFGRCPDWIEAEAQKRTYDLTLLTDIDVPFVDDPVRYLPDQREAFMGRCVEALAACGRTAVRLTGTWAEREARAIEAVDALLERGPDRAYRHYLTEP